MAGLNLGKLFKVPRLPKMGGAPKIPTPKPPKVPQPKGGLGYKPPKMITTQQQRFAKGMTVAKPTTAKMYASRADLQKATQAQSRASQGLISTRKMPTRTYATKTQMRVANTLQKIPRPKMPRFPRPSFGFSAPRRSVGFNYI